MLEKRLEEIRKRKLEIRAMLENDSDELDMDELLEEVRQLDEEQRAIEGKLEDRCKAKEALERLKDEQPEKRVIDKANLQATVAKSVPSESEKRGQVLKENRAVTVGASNIILPQYQATDIRPTFEEVSSLLDRVTIKTLLGGESFKQPYMIGYGTGDYKTEGAEYATAEPTFGYVDINKAKVTAYAEDTEEVLKLPAASYDAEVMRGITIAIRKVITRDILIGSGENNRLTGIFSDAATPIDPDTDLELATIDNSTLDEIVFSYGGDEEVEDPAVLILNKVDLKAFSQLRTNDGKKFHDIRTNGNVGTIDGIPFIINSACKSLTSAGTLAGDYCMAYGPLSNYMLCIFSNIEVMRSVDYKFKQGMIAHKGVVFLGGNVVSKNGFLRVKKASGA